MYAHWATTIYTPNPAGLLHRSCGIHISGETIPDWADQQIGHGGSLDTRPQSWSRRESSGLAQRQGFRGTQRSTSPRYTSKTYRLSLPRRSMNGLKLGRPSKSLRISGRRGKRQSGYKDSRNQPQTSVSRGSGRDRPQRHPCPPGHTRRAMQMVCRLLAYNAELDLARALNTYLADPNEYLGITRNMLHQPGEIRYSPRTITVTIRQPDAPRINRARALPIDQLDDNHHGLLATTGLLPIRSSHNLDLEAPRHYRRSEWADPETVDTFFRPRVRLWLRLTRSRSEIRSRFSSSDDGCYRSACAKRCHDAVRRGLQRHDGRRTRV